MKAPLFYLLLFFPLQIFAINSMGINTTWSERHGIRTTRYQTIPGKETTPFANYHYQFDVGENFDYGGKFSTELKTDNQQEEYSLEQSLSWQENDHIVSATLFSDVFSRTNPQEERGGSTSYHHLFFHRLISVGASAEYQEKIRHFDKAWRSTVDFTLPLTSHLKLQTYTFLGDTSKNRPRYLGYGGKLGIALNEHLFMRSEVTQIKENQDQKLGTDRGYYSNFLAKYEFIAEPFYDFLLSISYAFVKEKEDDPRSQEIFTVGIDNYALGLHYLLNQMSLDFLTQYAESNIRQREFMTSLGLTWTL